MAEQNKPETRDAREQRECLEQIDDLVLNGKLVRRFVTDPEERKLYGIRHEAPRRRD